MPNSTKKNIDNLKVIHSAALPYADDGFYALEKEKNSFWELVVKTTLIVAFFPWSLLFCVWFLGMDETIYLYKEIIKDLAVLVVALVLGLVGLCAIIFLIIFLFI